MCRPRDPSTPGSRRAFLAAMNGNRVERVEQFLDAVLQAPYASALKEDLLRGRLEEPCGADRPGCPVTAALLRGHAPVAAAYARAIARAPAAALSPGYRVNLLLARELEPMQVRVFGPPLLHRVVLAPPAHDGQAGMQRRCEGVYRYLSEVVASRMHAAEQDVVCASLHEGRSAARVALGEGRPEFAAAMLCAVLEHGVDLPRRIALLHAMRISVDQVVAACAGPGYRGGLALVGTVPACPSAVHWARRLQQVRGAVAVMAHSVS